MTNSTCILTGCIDCKWERTNSIHWMTVRHYSILLARIMRVVGACQEFSAYDPLLIVLKDGGRLYLHGK